MAAQFVVAMIGVVLHTGVALACGAVGPRFNSPAGPLEDLKT